MLHEQADGCDADPAAKSHKDWFSTCFNQLDNIGIESNRRHGKYDKEFGQILNWGEKACRNMKEICCNCGNH